MLSSIRSFAGLFSSLSIYHVIGNLYSSDCDSKYIILSYFVYNLRPDHVFVISLFGLLLGRFSIILTFIQNTIMRILHSLSYMLPLLYSTPASPFHRSLSLTTADPCTYKTNNLKYFLHKYVSTANHSLLYKQ